MKVRIAAILLTALMVLTGLGGTVLAHSGSHDTNLEHMCGHNVCYLYDGGLWSITATPWHLGWKPSNTTPDPFPNRTCNPAFLPDGDYQAVFEYNGNQWRYTLPQDIQYGYWGNATGGTDNPDRWVLGLAGDYSWPWVNWITWLDVPASATVHTGEVCY